MPSNSTRFDDKTWFRVVIRTDSADLVSDALVQAFELGGTEVRDDASPATVIAYVDRDTFETPDAIEKAVLQRLNESTPSADVTVASVEPYSDTDWATAWREHFGPVDVSPRVRVGPPWEAFDAPEPDAPGVSTAKVVIDPGMAFGTGTHETTRLSARLLDEFLADTDEQVEVLDVGTGSGILAIIAVKLGATSVTGIDISDDAIDAARQNAGVNNVRRHTDFSTTPIAELNNERVFPVVVANMLSHILWEIRKPLLSRVAPGGTMIVSGLTTEEADAFAADFFPAGWELQISRHQGEWVGLQVKAPDD